jgi:hypothetical protein
MPEHQTPVHQLDPSWRDLYRAGGICAALAVIMYLAAMVFGIITQTAPTSGGAAVLEYIHVHRVTYSVSQVLWLAPSLLLIVVFLALAAAFFHLNRSLGLVAGVIGVMSWAVSFAWPATGGGAPSLVLLSDRYFEVTAEAARAPFVAGAETMLALNDVPSAIGVLQTLGILLIALLMLKGDRFRGLAWFGVITGVVGIVSELLRPMLGSAYAVYGVLLFVWLIWISVTLFKLGAEARGSEAM